MSEDDARGISPTSMPMRRIPSIPPRYTRPPPRAHFVVAKDIPRRGLTDSHVWPDTGVLLALGVSPDLPKRFRSLYSGRARVPRQVENELRGHSRPSAGAGQASKVAAATSVVNALFIGHSAFPKPELKDEDMPLVERIRVALKGLPGAIGKSHGGEAVMIALAVRSGRESHARQVLLANDGGASVVAAAHGIATRHAADVFAEMACADPTLDADLCFENFKSACAISSPPASCTPNDRSYFACRKEGDSCRPCDSVRPQ